MIELKNKYRVVRDNYAGYEAQVKFWWFPICWFQIQGTNTSWSVERAEGICHRHAKPCVKEVEV